MYSEGSGPQQGAALQTRHPILPIGLGESQQLSVDWHLYLALLHSLPRFCNLLYLLLNDIVLSGYIADVPLHLLIMLAFASHKDTLSSAVQ